MGGADLYRGVLTDGGLTSESDSHSHRLGNPGAVGQHEVHAPGAAATSQLGSGIDGFAAPGLAIDAHRAGRAADIYSVGQLIGVDVVVVVGAAALFRVDGQEATECG